MLIINFANIEEFVLEKQDLIKLLPNKVYNQYNFWVMGRRHPSLSILTKNAMLELLHTLNDDDCINVLEKYYKQKISIESIDYQTVKNIKIPLGSVSNLKLEDFDNISTYRDADYFYISYWR